MYKIWKNINMVQFVIEIIIIYIQLFRWLERYVIALTK